MTKRIANTNAREYTTLRHAFKGSNLAGGWDGDQYIVWSYGWWPLYVHDRNTERWYRNITKYGCTTSKHAGQSTPTLTPGDAFIELDHECMNSLIRGKHANV